MVTECFYVLTMITLKISLAIFFLRIIIEPWQRAIVYGIISVATSAGVVYFIYTVFGCGVPVRAELHWERKMTQTCGPKSLVYGMSYMQSVVTTCTDLLLVLIPISVARKATINGKEKAVVIGIFVLAVM
jgi:rhodopsin domain-containing protein